MNNGTIPFLHNNGATSMLHTSAPANYIAAEKLAEPAICPECQASTILAIGRIHLGHYTANGELKEGLVWTCSDLCYLAFENSQFMGRA
jgi:hypothetical protein